MPGNTKGIVKDVNGQAAPQYFNPTTDAYEYAQGSNGAMNVQLTGSNMEYYGATVADRPDANSVPVGAVFMAVDTQEVWMSNGSTWVEV